MNKVKWGIIGTANIARWGMIPGMKQSPSCELYAIAGRSLEKAQKYKEDYGFEKAYGSYDELLDDPQVQAVYVPLPNDIHVKWVTEALKTRFGGDWVILTRFHARTKKFLKNYQLPETVINVSGYPDIQELMLCIDCGITDYSSWICEYMLRRKPGFTFATDVDNYSSHERTLFFPLSALPFPTSSNIDDLIANILAFDEEKFILDCNRFLKEKGSIDDGHAAERTVKEIKKLMGL